MSVSLSPYPEYKDLGLPWLGRIPAHWEVRRNGRLFSQRNETGFPDLPILEVSLKTGVRVRDMDNAVRKQVMSDFDKYKRADKGDVAYNMMRMWQGAVGRAPTDGLVSPAYVVARPHPDTDSRYYSYLFRTGAYMDEVNKFSRGIVSDRNRLYWEEFKQMPSAFPPRGEQREIANFLDEHGKRINRLIRIKQRLIELLNEQKQAIIHNAVTRSLDPDAPMKPTGLDWMPEVPKHWNILKLRKLMHLNPSKSEVSRNEHAENDAIFLPMEKVTEDGEIDCSERRTLAEVWNGFTYFHRQDVILAKITPCFENGKGAYLSNLDSEFGFGSTEFMVLRAGSQICPAFLYDITTSPLFKILGEEAMIGAAGQKRVPGDFVKDFFIALPPKSEQVQISSFLEREKARTNEAIQRARSEIDLIGEYRTRLISDVVTGKLDVRGVELPEVEEIEDVSGVEGSLPPILDEVAEESHTAS